MNVYLFEVARQIEAWLEKGQRHAAWFSIEDAADRVEEPGLITIVPALA